MTANRAELDTEEKAGLTRIQKPRRGWHAADIKAALEKRGIRLSHIDMKNDRSRGACSEAINNKWWPAVEREIAEVLGLEPWEIWPERYNDYGQPVQQSNRNMVKLSHAGRPRNADFRVVK